MTSKSTRVNLVFVDACREFRYKGTRSTRLEEEEAVDPDSMPPPSDKHSGTVIAHATAPNDVASDNGGNDHGTTGIDCTRLRYVRCEGADHLAWPHPAHLRFDVNKQKDNC